MKKFLALLVLAIAITTVASDAMAQPPHAKAWGKRMKDREWQRGNYYYYPSANVYYSPDENRYWYPRNGSWINVNVLPPSIIITNRPRYVVTRRADDEIWRDNNNHVIKYKGEKYKGKYKGKDRDHEREDD